ncbi:universal stress protein [Pseudonocardia sp.]|uniref:universal stress protein n=1 Tax=Pseudonocardia sp. TaxID=60912 RepID=UPI003D14602E
MTGNEWDGGTDGVVVGADASDSARIAAEWAIDLAAAWQVPLRLVHVVRAELPQRPRWLEEVAAAADREAVRCLVDVVPGDTAGVLLERSAGARLLVLGSYGSGAHTGLLTGSLGLALLEWARCPVATVRGTAPGVPPARSGPVIVGVDGGATGRAALAFGADLATAAGAPLHLLHAWTELDLQGRGAVEEEAATVLAEAAGWIEALRPGVATERELVSDTSLRALMDRAPSARALVVGHRRGTPHSELELGSTARGLVAFAPCPVAVLGPRCLEDSSDPARPADSVPTR